MISAKKGQGGIGVEEVFIAIVALIFVAIVAMLLTGAYKAILPQFEIPSNITFVPEVKLDYYIANASFQEMGCAVNSVLTGIHQCPDKKSVVCPTEVSQKITESTTGISVTWKEPGTTYTELPLRPTVGTIGGIAMTPPSWQVEEEATRQYIEKCEKEVPNISGYIYYNQPENMSALIADVKAGTRQEPSKGYMILDTTARGPYTTSWKCRFILIDKSEAYRIENECKSACDSTRGCIGHNVDYSTAGLGTEGPMRELRITGEPLPGETFPPAEWVELTEKSGIDSATCQIIFPVIRKVRGECTVRNFYLPQEITDTEEWLKGYGDPKYIVFSQALPAEEDTWTFDLGTMDKTELIVGLSVLGLFKAKDLVNVYRKTKSVFQAGWQTVLGKKPVKKLIAGTLIGGGVVGAELVDSWINKLSVYNNSLVLKIPYEEAITIPLQKAGVPVLVKWKGKTDISVLGLTIHESEDKMNAFHMVSPCVTDSVTFEMMEVRCGSYLYNMQTNLTICTEPEEIGQEILPSCTIPGYLSGTGLDANRYINSESALGGKDLNIWHRDASDPQKSTPFLNLVKISRTTETIELLGVTETTVLSGGGYNVSNSPLRPLTIMDFDDDGDIDTYQTWDCRTMALVATYQKTETPDEHNYCNRLEPNVLQNTWRAFKRIVIPVGGFLLSVRFGNTWRGTVTSFFGKVATVESITETLVVKKTGDWPGEEM